LKPSHDFTEFVRAIPTYDMVSFVQRSEAFNRAEAAQEVNVRVPTLIAAGLLCGFTPARLQAEPITLTVTGTLPLSYCLPCLQEVLGSTGSGGDRFVFGVTFDSDPVSSSASSDSAGYDFGVGSATLTIGNEAVTMPASVSGFILSDFPSNGRRHDQLTLEARFLVAGPGAVWVSGSDTFGNLLSQLAWPTDAAGIWNVAPHQAFTIFQEIHGDDARIVVAESFHATQAPGAPVPEPTTILLLGTGLAGLGIRRYRRKQTLEGPISANVLN
jgi:hypothetical protein